MVFTRIPFKIFIVFFSFTLVILAFADSWVAYSARGLVFESWTELEPCKVALLLGTSDLTRSGEPSPFFNARIASAAQLYLQGVVEYILASGDNSQISYNEPVKMQQALEQAGVAPDRIVLDYAGFSTIDSIIRAREVFGQDQVLVVSQHFHAERAVFLARSKGLKVQALAAADPGGSLGFNVRIREIFARLKAFFDIYIYDTPAVVLGPMVEIP